MVVLPDGSLGQMMEPAELPPMKPGYRDLSRLGVPRAPKAAKRRFLTSIYLDPPEEEQANLRLACSSWQDVEANEVRFKEYYHG